MNILVYNWRDIRHPAAGGAEVYITEVTRAWVAAGHHVTVFCAEVPGEAVEEVVDGIRVVRRGGRFGVYRKARRFWRERGGEFDLVVDAVNTRPFHSPSFVKDVPVVALIFQVAVEVWFREFPLPLALLGRYVLEPWWLRQYRGVPCLTISQSSRESLERFGLRDVQIVPVGLCPPPAVEVEKETVPTVIYVGRLAANKRPDHALEAFHLVRREIPEAQLWIVGDGPLQGDLARRAGPGVTLFGRTDEARKFELLARAHALVVTSVREGWGMVVSEAAAVGTPAVAYDVAGLRDSVTASGGALSEPQPDALARRLLDCLPAWKDGRNPALSGSAVPWPDVADAILAAVEERFPEALRASSGARP